ncbi:MAG TPA: c-type cytochrome [Candidatus Margulisiibacteriota bacterium]|nr:c-type cytochrome [Candidatus Margulisiibacteriota bacterium]
MSHTTRLTAALLLFATTAWAADGAAVYKANCAKCHGDSGQADTAAGKAMKVPPFGANVGAMSADAIATKLKGDAKHASAVKAAGDDVGAAAAYAKGLAK